MAKLNKDEVQLSIIVKAADAQKELFELKKRAEELAEEFKKAGKSTGELLSDKSYQAIVNKQADLVETIQKSQATLLKETKEVGEKRMGVIMANYDKEASTLRELETLRRHLRAKQSGSTQGTEDFEVTTKFLANVENRIGNLKNQIAEVKSAMKLDGSIFQDAKIIGSANLNQLTDAAEALDFKLKRLAPDTIEFIQTSQRLYLVNDRIKEIEGDYDRLNKKLLDGKQILNSALGYAAGEVVSEGMQMVRTALTDVMDDTRAYGKALSELEAITGASGDSLKDLEDRAASLTTITTQSGAIITNTASDILKAFKLVGSAKPELLGNAAALTDMTEKAIIFQKASGLELPDAVKYLTSTMAQFNATAEQSGRYINAIAAGAKEGATEIPDIASAIEEFGAGAASANFTIEESVALVETLGDKMIKGNEAGTALRNILIAIKAPDALGKEAQAALAAYNVDMNLLKDNTKTGGERLKELSKIVNDASAMVTVFGKENVTAAEILLRNTNRFDDLTQAVTGTNEAYRQAGAMADNLDGDIESLSKTAKGLFTEVGTRGTGTMRGFVQSLTEGIRWVKEHIDVFVILSKIVINAAIAYGTYIYSVKAAELAQKALTWAAAASNTVIAVFTGELKLATVAMNLFNRVSSINPLAAIAAFFTTAITLAISFTSTMKSVIGVKDEIMQKSVQEKATVEQLISTLKDEHTSRETKKAMIVKLNELYPDILKNYNLEKGDIKDLTKLQNELNAAIETRIAAEMRDAAVKDVIIGKMKAKIQLNKLETMRTTSQDGVVDEFGNTNFGVLDAQIEATQAKLNGFDAEIKKTNETFKALGYDLDKFKTPVINLTKTGTGDATNDFHKNEKEDKRVNLLAGSVAFLREEISKLNKEFENTPESKTPLIAAKLAFATKMLAEAEDKLNTVRNNALKSSFGRFSEEVTPLAPINQADVGKKIKGRKEINATGNAEEIKSLTADLEVETSKSKMDIERDKLVKEAKLRSEQEIKDNKAENRKEEWEENRKYVQAGIDAAKMAADTIFSIRNQQVEREKNTALKALDKEYKAKIDKAKDNTKQRERLEKEYDRKKEEIEKHAFERQKKMSIAQALINGALAITKILADVPKFDFGIATWIQVGLAAISTADQVATISSQKFAKGGIVQGARHAEGGIKMMDSKTGRMVGEMEGGEPYMILSDNTYRNNKEIIDALLNSSINEGGKRIFENGGIFSGASTTPSFNRDLLRGQFINNNVMNVDFSTLISKIDDLKEAIMEEKTRPAQISFQQLEQTKDLVDAIRKRVTNQ